ncbi:rhomboid family intramembrane serine protease [Niveibacterium sp.]|uniref:rhomboid family intramembrane serine protease n=1 Tax=Niveibacterium sp. TaxID=2017444 RepID=UPI0035AE94A8
MKTSLRWPRVSFAVAVMSLAAIALPTAWATQLELTRAPLDGRACWQLWSGHLLHFGLIHALTDLLTLLVAASVVETALGTRRTTLLYCVTPPVLSLLTLLTAPQLAAYRGASALAVMMGFAAGGVLWRDTRLRVPVALIVALFLVKLAGDAAGAATDLSGLPTGIELAWQAHAVGALIGSTLALHLARGKAAARYGMIST